MNKNPFDFSRPSQDVREMRAKHRKRRSNERKQDRSDIFLNSRNISVTELSDDDEPANEVQRNPLPSKDMDGFAKPKTPVVVKEKKYLSKYIEWKKSQASYKQKEFNLKKTEKKPFITAIKSKPASDFAFGSSFAPKDHQFKAPANVNKPSTKPGITKNNLRNQPTGSAVENLIAEFKRPNMKKKVVSTIPPVVPIKKKIGEIGKSNSEPITANVLKTKPSTSKTLPKTANPIKTTIPPKSTIPSRSVATTKQTILPKSKAALPKKNNIVQETPTTSKMVSLGKGKQSSRHPLQSVSKPLETPKIEDFNQKNSFLTSTVRKSMDKRNSQFTPDEVISPLENCLEEEGVCPLNSTITIANEDEVKNTKTVATENKETINSSYLIPEVEAKSRTEPKEINKTPSPSNDKPVSYLSPFVSVSRGKVSAQKEKARRSSIYVADSDYRASMATVERYRKILQSEIERMHKLCDEWSELKEQEIDTLTDHAIGMIDTTIGQTRLLTSKKLMQFKSIIDKCESHALARKEGKEPELGKGDAGPTLSEDVEGFWSMVSIQVDQVDRRFTNLNKWKDNDWNDPDDVPAKTVGKGSKKKTGVANKTIKKKKSNDNLKKLMMASRALLKEQNKNLSSNSVSLHESKSSKIVSQNISSQPGPSNVPRISIGLSDSKLKIPTPSRRSSRRFSLGKKTPVMKASPAYSNSKENWLESPLEESDSNIKKTHDDVRKSLFTFAMEDAAKTPMRKSLALKQLQAHFLTPTPQPRKSILKTPGTASKGRNVVFNLNTSPMMFTVDDSESPMVPINNKTPERSYKLRNRKIKLRPSSEIQIPK